MSSDSEIGKRMVEEMVLEQLLGSFSTITGRSVTENWEGKAEKVEGSPDHIIGLDGRPFGIELTEVRGALDAWDYVSEVGRLADNKSKSYARRGLFSFPIALVVHSTTLPLFDMQADFENMPLEEDFRSLGFSEIWAVDFAEAYYTVGHPFRLPDMFCFKSAQWFGFHRIGSGDRKPFG